MEFERIIDAVRSILSGNTEEQQQSSDILHVWQKTDDFLLSAIRVYKSLNNENEKYLCLCSIIKGIETSWFNYDRSLHDEYRDLFMNCLFINGNSKKMTEKTEEAIAYVLLNDWPDNYPDFLNLILDEMGNNCKFVSSALGILTFFLLYLNSATKITVQRRNHLLTHYIDFSYSFFLFVRDYDQFSTISYSFIKYIEQYFKALKPQYSHLEEIVLFVLNNFFQTGLHIKEVVISLTNLIESCGFLSFLLAPLQNIYENNASPEMNSFLCHYLLSFLEACDFNQSYNSCGIEKSLFWFSLLLTDRTTFLEIYWDLWSKYLQDFIETKNSFLQEILETVYPLLLTASYEMLPSSSSLSRLNSPSVQICIKSLYLIDPDHVVNFLSQQSPSNALFFAIGSLSSVISENIEKELLENIYPSLLVYISDVDSISSALFCLSRCHRFMSSNTDLFITYQLLLNELLVSDLNAHKTSALLALNHSASKIPLLLLTHCSDLVSVLFEQANPCFFERDDFLRLCRILTKIAISSNDTNQRNEMCSRVALIPDSFLRSELIEEIRYGADIAWAISSVSSCASIPIMQALWDPLIVAIHSVSNSEVFASVVSVFPATIRSTTWNYCRKACKHFMKIIINVTGHDSVILETFNAILSYHKQLMNYRAQISSIFASRLAQEDEKPPSFFDFFTQTGVETEEEFTVITSACSALQSMLSSSAKSAASLIKMLVRKAEIPFLLQWQKEIVTSAYKALFHRPNQDIVKPLAKTLFELHSRLVSECVQSDIIDTCIIEAICDVVNDQTTCQTFAEALRTERNYKEYLQILNDFLISYGNLNPTEMRLFNESLTKKKQRIRNSSSNPQLFVDDEDEFVNRE